MMSAASINGVTIGYDDAGTGENVLVLVHGHPFDRSMWRMQVGRISRQDAKTPRLQRVIDERERFERPRLAGDCTRSQLVWMKGVGHMPNLEREVEFNEAMERLLEAVQFPQYPLRLN
jgi:pimeloyl-ACP methyl ester carboxylesterase